MATVLEFSLKKLDRVPDVFARGPAEIIIFPGVRFERLKDDHKAFVPKNSHRRASGSNQAIAEALD